MQKTSIPISHCLLHLIKTNTLYSILTCIHNLNSANLDLLLKLCKQDLLPLPGTDVIVQIGYHQLNVVPACRWLVVVYIMGDVGGGRAEVSH